MARMWRPVWRSVLGSVARKYQNADPGVGGGSPSLTAQVQALFAKYSAFGGMWDFTDMATLFQAAALTTPVTASGQPVWSVADISGHGNHLTTSNASTRPQFNGNGVTPDGVDDYFVTAANLDLSACDKVVVAMGYTKVADTTFRVQFELSETLNGNAGTFFLASGNAPEYQAFATKSNTPVYGNRVSFTTACPNEYGAHIGRRRLNATPVADNLDVWWNGALGTRRDDGTVGTGNFGSYPLYLFARAGTSAVSNTPARRAIVLAPVVASAQVSDDDVELIRLWLMEGA